MAGSFRVEIKGRDEFWTRAFAVEWQDRFPARELRKDGAGFFLVEEAWLKDVEQVAGEVFCAVRRAPENPRRRAWLNTLLPNRDR